MSNIFFTGDLHLGHKNIIKYCDRRDATLRNFDNVDEMNEQLIQNWNYMVKKGDVIWNLGDIVFGERYLPLINRLNGTKKLVLGNHDLLQIQKYAQYFTRIVGAISYKNCILTHIPVHPSQLEFRFNYNIHGHMHNKVMPDNRYINVCSDNWNLYPVSLEELQKEYNIG